MSTQVQRTTTVVFCSRLRDWKWFEMQRHNATWPRYLYLQIAFLWIGIEWEVV